MSNFFCCGFRCLKSRMRCGLVLMVTLGLWPNSLLADPTRPPAWVGVNLNAGQQSEAEQPLPVLVLHQILIGHKKLAVINGQLLSEGDSIEKRTLIQIKKHEVVLKSTQGQQILSLLNSRVRQSVGTD